MSEQGSIERKILAQGLFPIGVDEVGKGCLAGPVYAASVELDYAALAELPPKDIALIRDSKTLSTAQRQYISGPIKECALRYKVGSASPREIEELGISEATFLAMRRSYQRMTSSNSILLIDGNRRIPRFRGLQQTVVKGDSLCYGIAAASILAKEARDDFMRHQSEAFPQYGFDSHVGYGTKRHLEMIHKFGICDLHRRNFAPIRRQVEHGTHPSS